MNKTLKKIRWRNIKANMKQFLSVVLIMLLSTTLLFGFIVNASTLKSAVNEYFEKTNLADVWVYTDKITDADRTFFSVNSNEYTERLYLNGSSMLVNQNAENSAKVYVLPKEKTKVSLPVKERGEFGCMIDKNVVENYGLILGYDDIMFDFEYKLDDSTIVVLPLKFRITGAMSFNECADTYSSWPVVIDDDIFLHILNLALTEKFGTESYNLDKVPNNQVVITTDNVEKTKQLINKHYATSDSKLLYLGDRDDVESVVLLEMEISQAEKMIYVFPVIFLIVSIMIILTTINQLIIQEKGKIGTLKSIGIPDKKVLNHYSSYGAYLCGIGALAGLILGPIIVPTVMFVKYNLVYSIPADFVSTKIPWLFAILVFAFMTLLGFVVSLFACYEILHKKPIECMKPQVKLKMKGKKKKSKLPFWMKMAGRNIKVRPIRTVMAVLGVAGCAALLICGFGIGDTLNHGLDNDFEKLFKYDVSCTYETADFEEKMLKIKSIKSYEKYEKTSINILSNDKSKTVMLTKFKADSKFAEFGLKENEFCLSKSIADELELKEGDEIVLEYNNEKTKIKLAKIQETSFVNGAFATGSFGFDFSGAEKGVWIDCENETHVVERLNLINGTKDAEKIDDLIEGAREKIGSINSITATLKTFAILLAVIVLLNLIMLILKERTKDIATMKVMGQGIFSIGLSLIFEMFLISFIGTCLGMVLGYPVLMLVLSINKVEIVNYLYYISPISYIFTILIVFGTILGVGLLSLLRVKKINMIESLKSVE